MTVIHTTDHG